MTTPFNDEIERALRSGGLHSVLRMLNARGTHRFTGIYRYDGEWLRNVALFDRWSAESTKGEDAPMQETFCAIVPSEGSVLEVLDGGSDQRFPWMSENAVVSYCGALIRSESGEPFGTLCHFDEQRCETASTEFPMMAAAAPLIYREIARLPGAGWSPRRR